MRQTSTDAVLHRPPVQSDLSTHPVQAGLTPADVGAAWSDGAMTGTATSQQPDPGAPVGACVVLGAAGWPRAMRAGRLIEVGASPFLTDAPGAGSAGQRLGAAVEDIAVLQMRMDQLEARQTERLGRMQQRIVAEALAEDAPGGAGRRPHPAAPPPGGRVQWRINALIADIAQELQLSERVVTRLMNLGDRLIARLGRTFDAWLEGLVTRRHVEVIYRELLGADPVTIDRIEPVLLAAVTDHGCTPAQLRQLACRLRERAEPLSPQQRHEAALRERCVTLQRAENGMAWVSVLLGAVDAAAVFDRTCAVARSVRRAADSGSAPVSGLAPAQPKESLDRELRTVAQLQADVVRDLLVHGIVPGVSAPTRHELHVERSLEPSQHESDRSVLDRHETGRREADCVTPDRLDPDRATSERPGPDPTTVGPPASGCIPAVPPTSGGVSAGSPAPGPLRHHGAGAPVRDASPHLLPEVSAASSPPGLGTGIVARVTVTVPALALLPREGSAGARDGTGRGPLAGPAQVAGLAPATVLDPVAELDPGIELAPVAELEGVGPIPVEVAAQLAAEGGTLRRLLTDPVSGCRSRLIAVSIVRRPHSPSSSRRGTAPVDSRAAIAPPTTARSITPSPGSGAAPRTLTTLPVSADATMCSSTSRSGRSCRSVMPSCTGRVRPVRHGRPGREGPAESLSHGSRSDGNRTAEVRAGHRRRGLCRGALQHGSAAPGHRVAWPRHRCGESRAGTLGTVPMGAADRSLAEDRPHARDAVTQEQLEIRRRHTSASWHGTR